jgi:hypothetical protein
LLSIIYHHCHFGFVQGLFELFIACFIYPKELKLGKIVGSYTFQIL